MATTKKRKKKRKKVVKFHNVIRMNFAVILFFIILIYVAASAFISMTKETISIYEVRESNINNNFNLTGVAIRKENVVKTHKSGYVCYFAREGEKVSSGYNVCAVDETGDVINSISISGDDSYTLTDEDYTSIRDLISSYKMNYSNEEFYEIYSFKDTVLDKVYELSSSILNDTISKESATVKSTLEEISSSTSGIVLYSTDGYEDITLSTIKDSDFNKSNYVKNSLKTGDIIGTGTAVFKMITDENWSVICQITADQAARLKNLEYLTFNLNGSEEMYVNNYEIETRGEQNYLIINLNKYMIEFISDRFLNVEVVLDRFEGLKVPNTSIVDKEVYTIQEKYITKDGNTNTLRTQSVDENGNVVTLNKNVKVYKEVDGLYYVDPEDLETTDVLVSTDGKDTIGVSLVQTGILKGVYIVNQGIADFNMIDILKDGDEFVIVSKDSGLREFDKIVMNSEKVTENQIVY
ncbi:MAG: hypothetical protein K6E28_10275 [Eubacterium sp.]|nr:hypothetical protein [Eubacterium sp.]